MVPVPQAEVSNPWISFDNCPLRRVPWPGYMDMMIHQKLRNEIEVYDVGNRRLYAKTSGGNFAIFEDELTPEELVAIAQDIATRRPERCPELPL